MNGDGPSNPRNPPAPADRPRLCILALLVIAAALFAVRGPMHAFRHDSDFILVYAPARAWLMGQNPYDAAAVDQAWTQAGGPWEIRPSSRAESSLIYPPSTLPMLAPWAALPWPASKFAWIGGNLVFLAITSLGLVRLAGWKWDDTASLLLVALCLLFMPVHTTFRHGQTPLLVMALIVLAAICCFGVPKGCLSGLATAMKPQIGLPFVALHIVQRRWKAAIIAIAIAGAVLTIGAVPMTMRGIPWWSSWQANLTVFTGHGEGDPTVANPLRSQLLNLHYPLHTLIESRSLVSGAVLAICAAIAALFFLWPRRDGKESPENQPLLDLSMVAVLSLLVVYHRFYDAVLLLLPLTWAIAAVRQKRFGFAPWCMLVLMVPFFTNSAAALLDASFRGWIPGGLAACRFWEVLVMPHQVWAMLLMAMVLLWARFRPAVGTP